MALIHQKSKIILVAILAAFSFALFTQHIRADAYSLSGTITDVNYDSGSITIAPDDNSNYTDIKGFSGNQLKSIAKIINNKHHKNDFYDFKLKNKNQIISYNYNATKTHNHDPYAFKNVMKWLIPSVITLITLFGIARALDAQNLSQKHQN